MQTANNSDDRKIYINRPLPRADWAMKKAQATQSSPYTCTTAIRHQFLTDRQSGIETKTEIKIKDKKNEKQRTEQKNGLANGIFIPIDIKCQKSERRMQRAQSARERFACKNST